MLNELIANGKALAARFEDAGNERVPGRLTERLLVVVYLRIIAIQLFAGGVIHWARITGLVDWRGIYFPDMPLDWQVSTVFFGVIQLVAGLGLWMTVSWGVVMWIVVGGGQILSHTVFSDAFGTRPWELSFYLLTFGVYLVLRHRADRRQR